MLVVTAWDGDSECYSHLVGRDVCNHPTIYKKDFYHKDLSDPWQIVWFQGCGNMASDKEKKWVLFHGDSSNDNYLEIITIDKNGQLF